MTYSKFLLAVVLCGCTAVRVPAQAPAGKTTYIVTDAGAGWEPVMINASGMMTGQGSNISYVWSRAGGLYRIPALTSLNGAGVMAWAVNDAGTVVGVDRNAGEAFIWDAVNGTRPLDTFGGDSSQANGINALGQVVGLYNASSGPVPFVWLPGSGWTALPLDGGGSGGTTAINASGQILGTLIYQGTDKEVIWEPDGSVRFLGNMLNQTENGPESLNDAGYVCGWTFGPLGNIGYVLDPAGNYTPIWNPINRSYSTFAISINNHNAVVGFAGTGSATTGFVWNSVTGVTFLNSALSPKSAMWNITVAHSINDRGQIAAEATLNGQTHAVLLTPVISSGPPPTGAITP